MLELRSVSRYVASRELFSDINIMVKSDSIVAIIGRNGEGKSTLLKILSGVDRDYEGDRFVSKGEVISFASQESTAEPNESVVNYITNRLPEYSKLHSIIENGEKLLAGSNSDIDKYGDAIERFTTLGYFNIENDIARVLKSIGLEEELLNFNYLNLSGGQQKLVDLAMIMLSPATILIFDEPTNHMDIEAKTNFIDWLKKQRIGVIIVTHDRDVLDAVDVICELKDKKLHEYPGNYQAYLKQNRLATSTSIHQYEIDMRSLENLKKQLVEVKRKKEKCKATPNPFVPLFNRLQKEYLRIEEQLQKPSAWIDSKSINELKPEEKKRYEKFKAKSINLNTKHESSRGSGAMLMQCENVQVGYDSPLFKPVSFRLSRGERVRLKGRNGAGKTTLIHALLQSAGNSTGPVKLLSGNIQTAQKLTFAEYKQHGDDFLAGSTLYECVEKLLEESSNQINETAVRRILAQYLFDPQDDASKQFSVLSGGEKARLSLMRLLLQKPDVMILDEPTNHLDLPSIEELEKLLNSYDGAVLYVSHDSYFAKELGGVQVELVKC